MKLLVKLGLLVLLLIAFNFMALAGFVAWLASSGRLSEENLRAMQEMLFPPEKPKETAQAETQPVEEDGAMKRLEELLSSHTGLNAGAQSELIRDAIDRQTLLMQQQRRELEALKRQIELAQSKVNSDRTALDARQKLLEEREKQLAGKSEDKAFQQTLKVYNGLQPKNVKEIFSELPDDVVVRYLRAMDPRRASRVLSEFKTPEELRRAQSLLELMREPDAAAGAGASNPAQARR